MRARRRARWSLLALLIALAAVPGCASHTIPTDGLDEPADARSAEELMCETELVALGRLIESRSADKAFPLAKLLEATELHRSARSLYLEGEYSLALELIKEGKGILEGNSG